MAIWRPTNDTPLTPLRTPFGLLADSVEADLDARGFARYATKADMNANTTAADGTHATVYADGTPANNGDYVAKGGAWSASGVVSGVVAPATNFSVTANTTQLVRYAGGMVTLCLYVVRTSGTISLNEVMAIIPAGFRPDVADSVVGGGFADGSGGPVAASIRVQPNGSVLYVGPTGKNTVLASVPYKAA